MLFYRISTRAYHQRDNRGVIEVVLNMNSWEPKSLLSLCQILKCSWIYKNNNRITDVEADVPISYVKECVPKLMGPGLVPALWQSAILDLDYLKNINKTQ